MSDVVPPQSPDHVRISRGDAAAGELEIVREVEVASGKAGRFYEDIVRSRSTGGDYVESTQIRLRRPASHEDGVAIVPIDEQDRILLLRQFRHAARMWVREIPRGWRDPGESVEAAAAREVREETGYEVVRLIPLGRIAPDGATLESVPHLVAARVRPAGEAQREATESIERVIPYRFSELRACCERGEIIDSYTIAGVLRLSPHFDGDRWLAE